MTAPVTRHVRFQSWESAADFTRGVHHGTMVRGDELVYGDAVGLRAYTDPHGAGARVTYEWAAWVSPEIRPGFAATSLVPSWNASTPQDSWLEVEVRVSLDGVTMSRWYSLGRWAETDTEIHPTSVPGQDDDLATVAVDTLDLAAGRTLLSYQVRISLLRPTGSSATPGVRLLGVMSSAIAGEQIQVSPGGGGGGTELAVPAYSQQTHRGEYPQWDGGGESWCSPTSTSMLLDFWGRGPAPADYAWVDEAYVDRVVDHAARHVFDHAYAGAGNWSFNVAYAARHGVRAFVTRLRSLTEAEQLVRAGVPLVATVSFSEGQLDGAGYATRGHLLTIVGFDESGNVVSHDPASHGTASNDAVRSVYDRAQFERVWLGSAGGVVYVIHPVDVPLPPSPTESNW